MRIDDEDLGRKSRHAIAWSLGGAGAKLLSQMVAQIVLARILGPDQYGLFAMGVVVLIFAGILAEAGIASSLVQKSTLSDTDIRYAFTWQVVFGLCASALVLGLATPIGRFFEDARLVAVLRALSLVCLLNASSAVAVRLLHRRLEFRVAQIAQVVGHVVGYILVGVPMALAGAEVWALIAAWLTQAVVTGGIAYSAVRHPLIPKVTSPEASFFLGFAGKATATNLANWWISTVVRVIVARFFPTATMGLYSSGFSLVSTLSGQFLSALQQVVFSASARATHDSTRVVRGFLTAVASVALIVTPVFFGMAAAADPIVLVLYGDDWRAMASYMCPAALAMPFVCVMGIATPFLWGADRVGVELRVQIVFSVLLPVVLVMVAALSVTAVAWSVLVLSAMRSSAVLWWASRTIGVTLAQLFVSVRGGVVLAFSVFVAIHLVDGALVALLRLPAGARLTAAVAVALIAIAAFFRACAALVPAECISLIEGANARLPQALRLVSNALFGLSSARGS